MFWGFGGASKACGIIAPWPGIELTPPCVGRQRLNHWTTKEVPAHWFCVCGEDTPLIQSPIG